MSVNLIDLVKGQLGNQVMGQVSQLLGESSEKTNSAISGAVPALLGNLLNVSNDTKGANSMLTQLAQLDDGVVGNFGSMLSKGSNTDLLRMGSSMLGSLFGDSGVGNLTNAIAGFSGMGKGSAGSLLGMLAPLVMGLLKRNLSSSGGLNPANLSKLLGSQAPHIAAAMPSGFDSHLKNAGLGNMLGLLTGGAAALSGAGQKVVEQAGDAVGNAANAARSAANSAASAGQNAAKTAVNVGQNVAKTASSTTQAAARGGNSMFRWLLPLIVVVALAWLLWSFLGRGRNPVETATQAVGNAAEAVGDTAAGAVDAAADAAGNAAEAVTDAAAGAVDAATDAAGDAADGVQAMTAALTNAVVGDVNVGQGLTDTFSSATSILTGVTDEATARTALPQITELTTKLGTFSGVLDQLPAEGRTAVSEAAKTGNAGIQALVDKVSALPGVSGVLKPALDALMQALARFVS
jgi:hypothetical protein